MKKSEALRKIEVLERQQFIDVYENFNKWLRQMGYRPAKIIGESSLTDNNTLIHSVDTLWSVEHYVLDALRMHLYFVRERNKHVYYFVHGLFEHSYPHTEEEFKAQILKDTKAKKEAMLNQLNNVLIIN